VVPLLNPVAYISVIAWAGIYYVRAITEERHLKGTDPDYEIYMKKVKYRFIPGVW
jgi:protein-S-isoprenylcysteine O-methyltransferase Ste14